MSTSRRYQSELREAQALETRARIRAAARRLFASDGFAATTIVAVAREAKVSVPTVYAVFGSKAGIVRELMDELEQEAGGNDAAASILGEDDPHRRLEKFAAWIRSLFETGAPVFRAARAARLAGDEDAAGLADVGNARRHEGARFLADGFVAQSCLRDGLSVERAADTIFLLSSAELYFLATDARGWTADQYEAWLRDTLMDAVLVPRPAGRQIAGQHRRKR